MSKSLSEQVEDWEHFLNSEQWKVLASVIESQVKTRVDTVVMSPLPTLDSALEMEFTKGEASFGRLILDLPQTQIEVLKAEITKLRKESDEDASDETDES